MWSHRMQTSKVEDEVGSGCSDVRVEIYFHCVRLWRKHISWCPVIAVADDLQRTTNQRKVASTKRNNQSRWARAQSNRIRSQGSWGHWNKASDVIYAIGRRQTSVIWSGGKRDNYSSTLTNGFNWRASEATPTPKQVLIPPSADVIPSYALDPEPKRIKSISIRSPGCAAISQGQVRDPRVTSRAAGGMM